MKKIAFDLAYEGDKLAFSIVECVNVPFTLEHSFESKKATKRDGTPRKFVNISVEYPEGVQVVCLEMNKLTEAGIEAVAKIKDGEAELKAGATLSFQDGVLSFGIAA